MDADSALVLLECLAEHGMIDDASNLFAVPKDGRPPANEVEELACLFKNIMQVLELCAGGTSKVYLMGTAPQIPQAPQQGGDRSVRWEGIKAFQFPHLFYKGHLEKSI